MALAVSGYGATTTISDTLTSSVGGAAWTGRIYVTLSSPGQAQPLYAGTTSLAGWRGVYCLGVTGSDCTTTTAAGAVTIVIWPTDQITPGGTSYRARYESTSGERWNETWVVATGNTKLYQVRSTTVPTPTTMFSPSQLSSGGATSGQCLGYSGTSWGPVTCGTGSGSGTVTSVSVTTANGVSGSAANATTTPAITLTLGAITPTSVAASGNVTGSNLSGTNTGDQTTITGNAGTATTLQTPRAINGVNFDGSAAITITANLPGNPTACSSGEFVSDIAADGTLTCGTPTGGAHTQNTDTGTTSRTFQLETGDDGPRLTNDSGNLAIYDYTGLALGDLRAGTITADSFSTSGSGAGALELTQGTAPTAGTTSVKIYAPSSVTSYIMRVPSAAGTGFILGTNTAGDVVQTFIGFTGTGDVVRTTGAQTAGRCVEIDASGNHIAASGACGGTGVNRQMTLVVVDPSSTGTKSCSVVEVAGTIIAAHLIANALPTGANLVVDVLKVAYDDYTGVGAASSITASAVPTIATGDDNPRYEDTTLTGWKTSVSANDVVCVAINTAPTGGATWASLSLEVQ